MNNKCLCILLMLLAVMTAGTFTACRLPAPDRTPSQTQANSMPTEASEASDVNLSKAPDFTAYDLNGNEVHLSDFAGKPVVLNFWVTWCRPCRSEMRAFDKVCQDLAGEVVFLMVNVDEDADTVSQFRADKKLSLPLYLDTQGDAAAAYDVQNYPTSIFIDTQGHLVDSTVGALNQQELLAFVEKIR